MTEYLKGSESEMVSGMVFVSAMVSEMVLQSVMVIQIQVVYLSVLLSEKVFEFEKVC